MAEQYGVEGLKKVFGAVAKSLSVVSQVMNNQGLWKLFELQSVLPVFSSLDFDVLKKEIADLSAAEYAEVISAFNAQLALFNPIAQAKILSGESVLQDAISLVEGVIADGKKFYADGVLLYAKLKALVA